MLGKRACDKFVSRDSVSRLKRLRRRPLGWLSKKDMGRRRMRSTRLRCSLREALKDPSTILQRRQVRWWSLVGKSAVEEGHGQAQDALHKTQVQLARGIKGFKHHPAESCAQSVIR